MSADSGEGSASDSDSSHSDGEKEEDEEKEEEEDDGDNGMYIFIYTQDRTVFISQTLVLSSCVLVRSDLFFVNMCPVTDFTERA